MRADAKGLAKNADGSLFLVDGKAIHGARLLVYVPTFRRADGTFIWEIFGLANWADTDLGLMGGFAWAPKTGKLMSAAGDILKVTFEQIPFILVDRATNQLVDAWFPPNYDEWCKARYSKQLPIESVQATEAIVNA